MSSHSSEGWRSYYQWRVFMLYDEKCELRVNRNRPPLILDHSFRHTIWRSCAAMRLLEFGVPGQACRIIEFYSGEKLRQFIRSNPTQQQYNEYCTAAGNNFPLHMAAAIIIATHLYHTTDTTAENVEGFFRHVGINFNSDQIREAVGDLASIHVVKFPMWTTVQLTEMLAEYVGLPLVALHYLRIISNVAEFKRYRLDSDLRQSFVVNIFGTDRVSSLKLAAACAYCTAKHLGFRTPRTLPLLSSITATPRLYLLTLSNLLHSYM